MSASAILNILVGIAIGGWLIYGGLGQKWADALIDTSPTATVTKTGAAPKAAAGPRLYRV